MKSDEALSSAPKRPMLFREMNLKTQLRDYLALREMSASQLARKAQVPKQSISGWLAGSNPRDVRQIKRVADVLGVSVDHLLFGKGTESPPQRSTGLEEIIGDGWVGGLFEVRLRRVKR